MGRFEVPGFAAGTEAIARAMSQATDAGATTVVGGGLPQRLQSHFVRY
jgi:phosphoglycerate kinase